MKKAKLVSLILVLMMLVPSALAESGYMTLRAALSDRVVMGQPVCLPAVSAPENAMLIINVPEQRVMLGGLNAADEAEVSSWKNVSLRQQLAILTYCCKNYSTLESWSKNGPMTIALRLVEDQENCYFIQNEGLAAACYGVLKDLLMLNE